MNPWIPRVDAASSAEGWLFVAAEAVAELLSGIAERAAAGAHGGGEVVPAGPAHLAQVALEEDGAGQHHGEPDHAEDGRRGERRQQEDQADHEADGGPLAVAAGVAIERGRAELMRG